MKRLLILLLALAACDKADMAKQEKVRTWDRSTFFADHMSIRPPVPGTVARDAPNPPAPMPAAITLALLARGEQRFGIFCTPCHGRAGDGEGMIRQRGFPQPPSFVSGQLRTAKAGIFWDAITHGHGAMYSFADRISPADRWAVIAYIRALQASQDSEVATLPDEDRARLEQLR